MAGLILAAQNQMIAFAIATLKAFEDALAKMELVPVE
jgi:hypothetical protein